MCRQAKRLSLGALGLSLALLVAGAWGTGFFYLAFRLGAGSPVRLAMVDGIHVYVGLATAAFFLVKVWRVGFRQRVPGVSGLLLWQRWISWSLLVLYLAIYVTGVVALLPLPARWLSIAVKAHLLSSVWAVVPTTWHAWHYRKQALPYIVRWKPRQRARRYWQALALVCLPIVGLVAAPRALSPLSLSRNDAPPADFAWWAALLLVTVAIAFLAIRMIRPTARPVPEEDQPIPLTIQEDTNASFQGTGRDDHGRLRSTGLQRSEHQHN